MLLCDGYTLKKEKNFLFFTARLIDLRPCQHDNGYMDGQSQIKVHIDEWTQVHSTQSSLVVTHSSTNR